MSDPSAPHSLRLVFAGTPETAIPTLHALEPSRHTIAGVLTRSDAPLGRKRVLTPSPVAAAADALGIPVIKANRIDDHATAALESWRPDLGVIVAYGGLLREPVLSLPRHGWINLHFSALPRWRGAAPVQRAILAGDTEIGVDVFRLVAALDAGDVLASRSYDIGPDETAGEVLNTLAVDGAALVTEVVDSIAAGRAHGVAQQGEERYAAKLTSDDGRVRWGEPAEAVYARIRAVTPEPGAFTTVAGLRLKILRARRAVGAEPLQAGHLRLGDAGVLAGTADDPLILKEVQPAGKRAMSAVDWWRGHGGDRAVAE